MSNFPFVRRAAMRTLTNLAGKNAENPVSKTLLSSGSHDVAHATVIRTRSILAYGSPMGVEFNFAVTSVVMGSLLPHDRVESPK
jgi:hypothetical protein